MEDRPDHGLGDTVRESVLEIRARLERDFSAKVTSAMVGEALVAV